MPEHVYASVVLVSKGAPIEHGRLNTTWTRDAAEPEVNGHPHFTNAKGSLHLFRTAEGLWEIAPEIDAGKAFAVARSAALHPNTIKPGEWSLPKSGAWAKAAGFKVSTEGPNTEEAPFQMEGDLGADFFLRVRTTKVVWYVDPATGEVMHSGAKAAGALKRPGKRYCPLCSHCFSANNFVSQHLRNLHTPPSPSLPVVTPDGEGGVTLEWFIEGWAAGAEPTSFAVQFSTDGGENWTTGVEDTQSSETTCHIASLDTAHSYTFRVAAHSIASLGPWSDSSLGVMPTGSAPPAQPPWVGGGGAMNGGVDSMATDDSISMADLVGSPTQTTAPSSPMFANPEPPAGDKGRGKRRAESDAGVESPEDRQRATADLVWSIEELVRTAQEVEEEGDASVHMLASLFGSSKRQRTGDQKSEELFLEDLLSSLGDGLSSMDADAPTYRRLEASGADRESSHRRLTARHQQRSGRLPVGNASFEEDSIAELSSKSNARLTKLRLALAAAPAFAKEVLLTPELLKLVGRADKPRELALIMTHAPTGAAVAAASEDMACKRAKTAQMFTLPPPELTTQRSSSSFHLPPAKEPSPPKRPGASASRGLLLPLLALMMSVILGWPLLGAQLDAFLLPSPSTVVAPRGLRGLVSRVLRKPPPRACHWTWSALGCVPSNAATRSCQLEVGELPQLSCRAE